MKNFVTYLMILIPIFTFSQSKVFEKQYDVEVKVESVDFVVTVDSAEELESTFKLEDLKTIFDDSISGESISLKIVCNGEKMSNGKMSTLSYKIDGNAKNMKEFMKSARKIKRAAIKYYKNNK
jgi:hypothetical protein